MRSGDETKLSLEALPCDKETCMGTRLGGWSSTKEHASIMQVAGNWLMSWSG